MNDINNMTIEERLEHHKQECRETNKPKLAVIKQQHIGRGTGTFVLRDLFESSAFIALSGVAPQMLIYILGKREFRKPGKTRICVNEDQIKLSYVELEKLGITQPRATRGFDELFAKGFIDLVYQGGGCQKDQNIYALSNQYLLWKKGTVFFKRPKVLKKGFQNSKQRQYQHTNP